MLVLSSVRGCSLLFFLLLITRHGFSQEKEPVHFSADSNTVSRNGEEIAVRYTGHVVITQGGTRLLADEATYLRKVQRVHLPQGVVVEDSLKDRGRVRIRADRAIYDHADQRAELTGRVAAHDSTATLTSESMTYWRANKRAEAAGSVTLEDGGRRLQANQMAYFVEDRRAVAQGQVLLADSARSVTVTGSHAEYAADSESGWVTGDPELVRTAAEGAPATIVRADQLEFFAKENRSLATGHVHVIRGKLEAFCDTVTFFEAQDRFVLAGSPRAVQVTQKDTLIRYENELLGQQMEILVKDNEAAEITVSGAARAESTRLEAKRYPGQTSYANGKSVRLFAKDEQVTQIVVEGNATSLYHLPPDEGKSAGDVNEASGDTIRVFFEDGEVSRVLVCGGVVGHYRPAE